MTCSALIAVVTVVIALGGCGDDEPEEPAMTASPTAARSCASPAGNSAPGDLDQVIWPPVPFCTSDPTEVARSFATEYIGLDGDPQIGEFREDEGEPPAGEIDIFRRGEDGRRLDSVASTLSLRVLDDAHY